MTITYYIDNTTPDLVKTVMLRKFFQMVFIGDDRKSLHIYTASVIGGGKEVELEQEKQENADSHSTCCVSQLNELKAFRMKFDFVVRGNDNNDVISIYSEDITDGDRGFLSQIECIHQIWGKECQIIQNSQTKLNEIMKLYLPSTGGSDGNVDAKDQREMWSGLAAELAKKKILYLGDEKKKREGEMFGFAIAGEFEQTGYDRPLKNKKGSKMPEGSERAFYCIQVPRDVKLVPGIELVNWIKTTINFRHRFHDSNLNFCVHKKEKSETGVRYIAPDFTWYFSPPVKTFINNESSSVELKLVTNPMDSVPKCKYQDRLDEGKETCELLKCTCPVKKLGVLDHTTTRYQNVINPVANKTTVNFKQWTDDEMISYRQKYRLAVRNIFTRNVTIDNTNEINIFLDTTDEHGRGNRQFVLGLFISFALAFGIDSSRLEQVAAYFPFPEFLEPDAWWLALLTLLSLNMLIRPPQAENEHLFYVWRRSNLIGTLLWVACVFIVLRSRLLLGACIPWKIIEIAVHCLYGILGGSNLLYIICNVTKYRDPILSSLFNDDIL